MKNDVCYFTQMYQAVPSLKAISDDLGGTFVCGRRSTYQYLKTRYPGLSLAKYNKRIKYFGGGDKALHNAKCIVTGSPYQRILSPYSANKLMVFHGTYAGLSKEALNGLKHFDHLFLIGPRMERMLNRYRGNHEYDYTVVGFVPFSHFPEKTATNKCRILSMLGLDPNLKTIVYCPSRKKEGSWDECAESMVDEVSSDFNLVMRPHPSQSMNMRFQDRVSMRRLMTKVRNRKNTVIDMVDADFPDLLMIADLLVSDANSPAEEALYYDTPQLIVGAGKSSYREIKKIWVDWNMADEDVDDRLKIFSCGPVFNNGAFKNWDEAAKCAINESGVYAEIRLSYFHSIFGQRNKKAGSRIAQYITKNYL